MQLSVKHSTDTNTIFCNITVMEKKMVTEKEWCRFLKIIDILANQSPMVIKYTSSSNNIEI
jgi:hypothetical protein